MSRNVYVEKRNAYKGHVLNNRKMFKEVNEKIISQRMKK